MHGMSFRCVACNCVKAHTEKLPVSPVAEKVEQAEMDKLFSFIKDKKHDLRDMHSYCKTHCILGWKVVWERTQKMIQQMIDQTQKTKRYFSDAFSTYAELYYHGGNTRIIAKMTIHLLERILLTDFDINIQTFQITFWFHIRCNL